MSWEYHTIFPHTKIQDKADSPAHLSNTDVDGADNNNADNDDANNNADDDADINADNDADVHADNNADIRADDNADVNTDKDTIKQTMDNDADDNAAHRQWRTMQKMTPWPRQWAKC